jgi:DinB family
VAFGAPNAPRFFNAVLGGDPLQSTSVIRIDLMVLQPMIAQTVSPTTLGRRLPKRLLRAARRDRNEDISSLQYTSNVDSTTRRLPAGVAAVPMFDHGIHHRGQLTTLLKQADVDPGVTDLPWLPRVVEIVG